MKRIRITTFFSFCLGETRYTCEEQSSYSLKIRFQKSLGQLLNGFAFSLFDYLGGSHRTVYYSKRFSLSFTDHCFLAEESSSVRAVLERLFFNHKGLVLHILKFDSFDPLAQLVKICFAKFGVHHARRKFAVRS